MGKKSAPSASAKAKAKAASAPKVAAATSGTQLDEEPKKMPRRQLNRRDTEQQVERALRGPHFRHLSEATLTHKTIDGLTLRQRLTDAVHALEKGQRIGSTVYTKLARDYGEGEDALEKLKPSDPNEPVNDALLQVLSQLEAENACGKSLKAFQMYMETCSELSERNLLGLVKACLSPRARCRSNADHVVAGVMVYFSRTPQKTGPTQKHVYPIHVGVWASVFCTFGMILKAHAWSARRHQNPGFLNGWLNLAWSRRRASHFWKSRVFTVSSLKMQLVRILSKGFFSNCCCDRFSQARQVGSWVLCVAHRMDVKNKYHLLYEACVGDFDRSLREVYCELKKSNVQLSTFLRLYHRVIVLVCDALDIELVRTHASDLAQCKPAVCRLVQGSLLGSAMFGDKMLQISANEFSADVDAKIFELSALLAITKSAVKELREKLQALADQTLAGSTKEQREREVMVKFLGSELLVCCPDLYTEAECKVMACLKSLAWGKTAGLTSLPFESWVVTQPKREEICKVAGCSFEAAEKARQLCADMVRDPRISSFSEMKNIIKKKAEYLCSLDPTFHLELSWLDKADARLEQACLDGVLACLPSRAKAVSLGESLSLLSNFRQSEMVKRASVAAQERVSSVENIVQGMTRGVSPKSDASMASDFYTEVLSRVALFFSSPAASGSAAPELRGKAAVDAYVEVMKGKRGNKECITLAEIEALRPYWWLLTGETLQSVTELTKYAVEAMKHAIPKCSNEDVERTSAKAKRHKVDALTHAADSLVKLF